MNKHVLVATLQGIQFLRGVSKEHLEQIAAIAEMCDFQDQEFVFQQGDNADCIYLVVFGRLSIQLDAEGPDCKQIISVGPGEMLGWSSLLDRPQLAATARAIEPTRLVRIDSAKLLKICDEDKDFGFQFMRRTTLALAKRLNATWTQLSHLHVSHFLPVAASAVETDE